jgi:hypothetical protein
MKKTFGKDHHLNLNYNRRTDRPNFQDLSPFEIKYDPYTFESGNSSLQPQLSENIEAGYFYKTVPFLTLGVNKIKNAITEVFFQADSSRLTFKTIQNIRTKYVYTGTVIIPVPIKKWFLSINYFNLSRTEFTGTYNNKPLFFRKNTFTFHSSNVFTLAPDVQLEVGAWYRKGGLYGLSELEEIGGVFMGAGKSFLNKKLKAKLNVQDIFRNSIARLEFKRDNIDSRIVNIFDSRFVTLTLTWSIGNNLLQRQKEADENRENKRIREQKF